MTETKKITEMTDEEIKEEVRKAYTKVAQRTTSCCGPTSSCSQETLAEKLGYEVMDLPDSVTESFAGCGNPVALASLQEGDVVLDLGSGAGLDAFTAAHKVGPKGRVIGVDMTTEMTEKAKLNAEKLGAKNVEFRQGDIEALPVDDKSVDVIISNCVINLAPDKRRVFREVFRVLKPGGRLMVSDIVLTKELPEAIKNSITAYVGCISGAEVKGDYLEAIESAGFVDIKIFDQTTFPIDLMANDPTAQAVMENLNLTQDTVEELGESILSVKVSGIKMDYSKIS